LGKGRLPILTHLLHCQYRVPHRSRWRLYSATPSLGLPQCGLYVAEESEFLRVTSTGKTSPGVPGAHASASAPA
jgi:hypothetical protein